eukprot:TRINITY_DN24752_c0_g2_i1.p1 TRINITY_DN24752_c0_g2~~TRINITY_DN24752_c0_g2_i1.p1  ORF type:complete len:322 (+),score=33.43 TRINITY_DN24752_c0_g2_i1:47-1012(+)
MGARDADSPFRHQGIVKSSSVKIVDHPAVAWIIENACIISVAWLRSRLRLPRKQSFPKLFLNTILGGFILIEGCIALQYALITKVYAHIPYFKEFSKFRHAKESASSSALRAALSDWLKCNLRTHLLSSCVVGAALSVQPKQDYVKLLRTRFRLRSFLLKLFAVRVTSDVFFYAIHRALHSRYLYRFHKRHHEHTSTTLASNFHFSVVDLFLEGFVPLFAAVVTLQEGLKVRLSHLDSILFTAYIQWYEIGSHSGKPMPTVTFFPPLAPLYAHFLPNADARNVEFHDHHHAKRNCNYGITQWLDRLLGTMSFSATPSFDIA